MCKVVSTIRGVSETFILYMLHVFLFYGYTTVGSTQYDIACSLLVRCDHCALGNQIP